MRSTGSRSGYMVSSARETRPSVSRTFGEQAKVFSLKSRRSAAAVCRAEGDSPSCGECRSRGCGAGDGRSFIHGSPRVADCFGVAVQAFRLGERDGCGARDGAGLRAVYSCTVMTFRKSITLRPPRTRASAAGGQGVIRAGDVIAQGLRGIVGRRRRNRHSLPSARSLGRVDGEVFGGERVGDGAGFSDG